ncbi:hypothetical protein PHYBOEH_007668 [Phytophthora boehmeriae]|uniref:RxLR effector protein n=1 Tax=Phytophthora boehmeriae TaxID=109152 RepID=A0A8T1W6E8_9STRA|nr:hypothetical protein PHYBOEH_007668 [Phytophthora boehmeriae]
MRVINFLFLAATALVASSKVASASTESTQAKLSATPSLNVLQSIDAVHDSKRLLRTIKREEVDDDDDSDDDDELDSEEERMMKPSTASSYKFLAPEADVVAAALAREPTLLNRAEKKIETALGKIPGGKDNVIGWKTDKLSAQAVKESLLARGVSKDSDEWKSYLQYLAIELVTRFPPTK